MSLGFILQSTYYIERGRAVVHLFGKDEDGDSFVVRDDRYRPHFFILTDDLERALKIHKLDHEPTEWQSPDGRSVERMFVDIPPDTPNIRDEFHDEGIATFEADIPFTTGYLIHHGLHGAISIEGESRPGKLIGKVYQNPTLGPADWTPELSVLSIDIETDRHASKLLSFGLHGEGVREVHILGEAPEVEGIEVFGAETEADLCKRFVERVRAIDPDVLTGWNVIDFDFRVLEEIFVRHRVPFQFGRANLPCKLRLESGGAWGASRAIVPGRVVLDALTQVRDNFIKLEDYRLETAGREILGKGKVFHAADHAAEIMSRFETDRASFVEYNLIDCSLVTEILVKKKLIELGVRRSNVTGMPLDRLGASIATFDFSYIGEMHKHGRVAITVPKGRVNATLQGGFVFDSVPGIYRQVGVFDFKSLYPSIIRTFRLDPLRVIPRGSEPSGEGMIQAPNGARFEAEGGILPRLLDRLFPLREEAKAQNDPLRSHALKILMNSFYGVLGTTRCRFYSPETANAITGFGQKILRWTRDVLEKQGYSVLYGDTDSLFVDLGNEPDEKTATEKADVLARELTRELAQRLEQDYEVESKLELEFEKLYRRLILPALRNSAQGSKKRYVGLIEKDGVEELDFVGLESVRRDWTDVAKEFQRALVELVFKDEPVEAFTRNYLDRLRAGHFDEGLVYKKALRKATDEYTSTTPPHVQAARKMSGPPPRVIRYVFTIDGPEPVDERKNPFDYEHYVEKQVRPVGESILTLLGMDWGKVTGMQGTLF